MTVQEIANRFVALCQEDKMHQIYTELCSPTLQSVEPEGATIPSVQGLEAIYEKGERFRKTIAATNRFRMSEPLVADQFFAIAMYMNVDLVDGPKGVDMDELCIYEVQNGKIVKEEFRYAPVPQTA